MENITKKYTCDFCGEECSPRRIIEVQMKQGYMGENHDCIIFKISGSIPYGTASPDICNGCVEKAMQKYLLLDAK